MKKTLLAIVLLVLSARAFSQKNGCMAALSYTKFEGPNEKRINSPASVCYDGNYFSFYTKATGTRTFKVTGISSKVGNDGNMVENFLNDENQTNMRGDVMVEIDYGKTTTVMISFTRFGQAYMVQGKGTFGRISTGVAAANKVTGKSKGKIVVPNFADGKMRVASAPGCTFLKNGLVSTINAPIAICYDGKTFSFYSKALGGGVFSVTERLISKNPDGSVEEKFEDKAIPGTRSIDGTLFDVKILYSTNTVITIENIPANWTSVIATNNFSINLPTDSRSQRVVANMGNVWKHPFVEPVPPFNVLKWVLEKVDMPQVRNVRGAFNVNISLTDSGKVTNVEWGNIQFSIRNQEHIVEEFKKRATPLLLNMPQWRPAVDTRDKRIDYTVRINEAIEPENVAAEGSANDIQRQPLSNGTAKAVPPFDIIKWLSTKIEIPELKRSTAVLDFDISLSDSGKVTNIKWNSIVVIPASNKVQQKLQESATALLLEMPLWTPALNTDNLPIAYTMHINGAIAGHNNNNINNGSMVVPTLKTVTKATGLLHL